MSEICYDIRMDSVKSRYTRLFEQLEIEYDETFRIVSSVEVMSDNKLYSFYVKKLKSIEEVVTLFKSYKKCLEEIEIDKQLKLIETDSVQQAHLNSHILELEKKAENLFEKAKQCYNERGNLKEQRLKIEISCDNIEFLNLLENIFLQFSKRNNFKVDVVKKNLTGERIEITGIGAFESLQNISSKVKYIFRGVESTATISVIETDNNEIEFDESDLEIQTLKSSGAGGQHINKTESAVRVKHVPTGIVAECQDDRSQQKNKYKAIEILKAKVIEFNQKNAKKSEEIQRKNIKNAVFSETPLFVFDYDKNRVFCTRTKTEYNFGEIISGNLEKISNDLRV